MRKILLLNLLFFNLFVYSQKDNCNYRIFKKSESNISFYFTPSKDKIKQIELLLKQNEFSLWKTTKRQYKGINHPKEGKIIAVNIIPSSLIVKDDLNWKEYWIMIADEIRIRKATYYYKSNFLKIIPKSNMGG